MPRASDGILDTGCVCQRRSALRLTLFLFLEKLPSCTYVLDRISSGDLNVHMSYLLCEEEENMWPSPCSENACLSPTWVNRVYTRCRKFDGRHHRASLYSTRFFGLFHPSWTAKHMRQNIMASWPKRIMVYSTFYS